MRYNVNNINTIDGPSRVEVVMTYLYGVESSSKCEFNAYKLQDGNPREMYTLNKYGVNNPVGIWCCNSGDKDNNFGKIFYDDSVDCVQFSNFCSASIANGYTAISRNTSGVNYCEMSINLNACKTCADLNYGDRGSHFIDTVGNTIGLPTLPVREVKVICPAGNNPVFSYKYDNFSATFYDNGLVEFESSTNV